MIKAAGDYARGFVTEHGKYYRKEVQDIDPAIKHVKRIRSMHDLATKSSNTNEWRHVGSVPTTILIDWLNTNRYTIDQWARNDGGAPGFTYPDSKTGVKDKFMAYFLSRDFAKLHNMHVTTKRESNQIVLPRNYRGGNDEKPGRIKDPDS